MSRLNRVYLGCVSCSFWDVSLTEEKEKEDHARGTQHYSRPQSTSPKTGQDEVPRQGKIHRLHVSHDWNVCFHVVGFVCRYPVVGTCTGMFLSSIYERAQTKTAQLSRKFSQDQVVKLKETTKMAWGWGNTLVLSYRGMWYDSVFTLVTSFAWDG